MADLVIDKKKVAPVLVRIQSTAPSGEAMDAGHFCRRDANGRWWKADASASGTANGIGMAMTSVNTAGQPVTVMEDGIMNVGDAVAGLAIDAVVYLSDTNTGILADAAGTVSVAIGRVVPGLATTNTPPDKLLEIKRR